MKNFKNNKTLNQFENLTGNQYNSIYDKKVKMGKNKKNASQSYEFDNYSLKSKSYQHEMNQNNPKIRNFSSTSFFNNNDKEILIPQKQIKSNTQKFSDNNKDQLYNIFKTLNILILKLNNENSSNIEKINKILRCFQSLILQIQDPGIIEVKMFLKHFIDLNVKNQNDDLINKLKDSEQKLSEMIKHNRSLTLNYNSLNEKKLELEEKYRNLKSELKKSENKYLEDSKAFEKKEKEFSEAVQYFAEIYNENSILKEHSDSINKNYEKSKEKYIMLRNLIKGTTIKYNENSNPEIIFNESQTYSSTIVNKLLKVGEKQIEIPSLNLSKLKKIKPGTFALIKNEKIPVDIYLNSNSSSSVADLNSAKSEKISQIEKINK